MSVTPAPAAAGRGQVALQPSYFTSSLYVHPLRDDIQHLIHTFAEQQIQSQTSRPFVLFKKIWNLQGWPWIHFKVFDARARETFLKVTARLFIERLDLKELPLARVVALFGLYTFLKTQIPLSAPPLHAIGHAPIPIDQYVCLLDLPSTLTTAHLLPLQPHATYILSVLLTTQAFHIVPASEFLPLSPCELPRERFVQDVIEGYNFSTFSHEHFKTGNRKDMDISADVSKKKGRPTKREKAKKAKDALALLEKWLDKNAYTPSTPQSSGSSSEIMHPASNTSHVSTQPISSLTDYRTQKLNVLESLDMSPQSLHRANQAVLARMKKIDEVAAEQGLEVGGEGGERTGLARVEKAAAGLNNGGKGILGLLEGAGMDDVPVHVTQKEIDSL